MIERKPGVSICIPNWNHRNFLPRSIASAIETAGALRGQGVECEIIVVDDCSRDGSQRALLSLVLQDATGLIDVILRPENRGLAAARNEALAHVRYRYVCFLDADNELIAGTFMTFVRAMRDIEVAAIYGNLIKHDGRNTLALISNDYVSDMLYEDNYIDALGLYDTAKLLAHGGYDETMTSHEDWEMFLHLLAENEEIVFVPACMGYYYSVPHSMVQTQKFDHRRMHRIYNQARTGLPLMARRRSVYHPDIGWLVGDAVVRDGPA